MRFRGIITFAVLCLCFCNLFAQTAALEILGDPAIRKNFYLYINGVKQNESPVENILVKGMPFEVYGVEIQVPGETQKLRKVAFLRIGKTTNYVFSAASSWRLSEGQGQEKPYGGKILTINYKSLSDTNITITEEDAEKLADLAAPQINFDDEPELGQSNPTPAQQLKEPVKSVDPGKLRFNADSMFKGLKTKLDEENAEAPCQFPMSAESVREVKNLMKEYKNLRERYNLALKGIGSACITVAQLKELMRLLDGDDLKVEFYREIFHQISDFARRSDLFELFFFESSIDEIQNLR